MRSTASSSICPTSIGLTRNGYAAYAEPVSAASTLADGTATRNDCSVAGLVETSHKRGLGPLLKSHTWAPSPATKALERFPSRAFSESDADRSAYSRDSASRQGTTYDKNSTQDTITGSPLQSSPPSSEISATFSPSPQGVELPSQPSRGPISPTSPNRTASPTRESYTHFYPFDLLPKRQPKSTARSKRTFAAVPRRQSETTGVHGTVGTDSAARTRDETAASMNSQTPTTTYTMEGSYTLFPPLSLDVWRRGQLEMMAGDGISV